MSILDKLMEKKDLRTYIDYRIQHLRDKQGEIPDTTPKEKRETARKQVKGRIEELKRMRHLLAQGRLKEASKQHWKDVNAEENGQTSQANREGDAQ